ncbi:MAG: hypothetical protein AAFY42_03970 [Pseudomonadota bacterium]
MDSDLVIIAVMIITVVAIIGGSVNAIISKATEYYLEKSRRESGHTVSNASNSQLAERTDMIEERLAVLERLATDKGTLLSDEIEALRLDVAKRREKENG